jgi:hypothetical protein
MNGDGVMHTVRATDPKRSPRAAPLQLLSLLLLLPLVHRRLPQHRSRVQPHLRGRRSWCRPRPRPYPELGRQHGRRLGAQRLCARGALEDAQAEGARRLVLGVRRLAVRRARRLKGPLLTRGAVAAARRRAWPGRWWRLRLGRRRRLGAGLAYVEGLADRGPRFCGRASGGGRVGFGCRILLLLAVSHRCRR